MDGEAKGEKTKTYISINEQQCMLSERERRAGRERKGRKWQDTDSKGSTCHPLYFPVRRQGAAQTSRPASHIPGSDLGGPRPGPVQRKSEDWGMSAFRAHSIFRPSSARMSGRARKKCIETCSPGRENPCTCHPAGKLGGVCVLCHRVARTAETFYSVPLSGERSAKVVRPT